MHRFSTVLIGGIAVVAFTQFALAADLPRKAPAYTPPPPPVYSWTGFYVGGHFGYGWGSDPIIFTPDLNYAPAMAAGIIPSSLADNPKGVLGGIQYGTNWQFNRVVLGLESDFSFSDIKASQTLVTTVTPTAATNFGEQKLTWFSTTRGRAGVGLCPAGTETKSLWGWTAGGGLEYGVGHWSVKIEYLHYDLGHLNYSMIDPTLPGAFIEASTKFSGDIIRGGVNYRFDWTPWELIFGRPFLK
jgi:outer membrane immunogenic protein